MVKTNSGLNRLRDLWTADVHSVVLGTGNTPIDGSETSVEGELSATEQTPIIASGNNEVRLTHTLNAATANGEIITKIGVYSNNGNTLDDIYIFPPFDKTENIELITTITTRWR